MKLFASLALAATLLTSASATPLTWTTFELNGEGWGGITADSALAGFPMVLDSLSLQWHPSGGSDGGGYISLADADVFNTMFRAPGSMLGNIGAALGGTLRFDTKTDASPDYSGPVVAIQGGGVTLIYKVAQPATGEWSTVEVGLAPGANWHLETESGAMPTAADFLRVFGNASAFWISAENHGGVAETTSLDNVVLSAAAAPGVSASVAAVPEPSTTILMVLGLGGLVAYKRRSL